MKWLNLFLFPLLTSCGIKRHLKSSPPTEGPPPQPPVVDPIDLVVTGENTKKLTEQSHITPFLTIVIVTLLICFIPYFYVKLKPHFINSLPKLKRLKEWTGEKLVECKDWVKKKIDKKKE